MTATRITKILIISSATFIVLFSKVIKELLEGVPWYALSHTIGTMIFEFLFIVLPIIAIGLFGGALVWKIGSDIIGISRGMKMFNFKPQKPYLFWFVKILIIGCVVLSVTIAPVTLYKSFTRGYIEKVRKEKGFTSIIEWDTSKNKWKRIIKDSLGFIRVTYAQYPPGTPVAPFLPPEMAINPHGNYVMEKTARI